MKKRLRKKYQQQAQQREKTAKQATQDQPLRAGWELFHVGRYREAIAAWKDTPLEEQQALQPVLAEAYFRLAIEQHAANKDQAALTFLQQAVNLAPEQWLYYYHLALTFHRLGNLPRAAVAYRQALACQPANQRVLLHLGLLMVQQELASPDPILAAWLAGPEGESLAAPKREFLQTLPALARGEIWEDNLLPEEPAGNSTFFLTGIAYAKKGEWAAAKTWLEQAAHRSPDRPACWLALGEAQAVTGDLQRAGESLERALALGAGEEAHAWLAAVNQAHLIQAAAANDLATVIRLLNAQDNPPGALLALAYFTRGNQQARNEHWAEAKADWEKAVSCGPAAEDLPDIMHNLALLAEREGRPQEAVRYWRRTISAWSALLTQGEDQRPLGRYLALAYRHLAELLLEDGNLSEAAMDLELALRYHPGDTKTRLLLASIEQAMEEPQKAISTLLPVVQEQPGNVEAVGMLATIYTEIEKYDAAKNVLHRGLAIEPQEPVLTQMLTRIGNRLARQYMSQGEWLRARHEIEETLRLNPQDQEALSLTGIMACLLGKEKEGEEWFQKILRLTPEDPRAHLVVGEAYFMVGHPRKASARLKAAMDLAGNAPTVCFQAAKVYLAAQKEKQAEAALLRALDYPGISREEVFLEAFTICCDRHACELARDLLRRAVREFPQNVELQFRYVQCLIEAGDEQGLEQLTGVEKAIAATGTLEENQEWKKLRFKLRQILEELLEE